MAIGDLQRSISLPRSDQSSDDPKMFNQKHDLAVLGRLHRRELFSTSSSSGDIDNEDVTALNAILIDLAVTAHHLADKQQGAKP